MNNRPEQRSDDRLSPPRRGSALLLSLFVIAITSTLVIAIWDTQTAQLAALNNTTDYERALYLAGAAVHHALANLEEDSTWRGTSSEGSYPASGSYSATATDGDPGEVLVEGVGVSGSVTRKLQITVAFGS